ncbi:MAG: hypothetical protein ABGW77_01665 [Campylobacterales bacterium]
MILLGVLLAVGGRGADLGTLFKQGKYRQICQQRWGYIKKFKRRDERVLSVVAYSCLKIGGITPALDLAKNLYKTPTGRVNGSYISALFLIKKLLIQVIRDNLNLTNLKLPTVEGEGLLLQFFNRVKGLNFSREGEWIVTKDRKFRGKVTKGGNIVVEELDQSGNPIKKELYW